MTTNHAPRKQTDKPHTFWHNCLEAFGIGTAYSMVAVLLWRSASAVADAFGTSPAAGAGSLATLLAAMFAGYVLADLVSGLIHFTFDRFFAVTTPFIGSSFVKPFRDHHEDPNDITLHGFLETNGNTALATVPMLVPMAFADWDFSSLPQLFVVAMLTILAISVSATNQFHKWAHTDELPALLALLARAHLILGKEHHAVHHRYPFETYYCITTGWLNPPLARIGFWKKLEWLGAHVFRAHVHRDPPHLAAAQGVHADAPLAAPTQGAR